MAVGYDELDRLQSSLEDVTTLYQGQIVALAAQLATYDKSEWAQVMAAVFPELVLNGRLTVVDMVAGTWDAVGSLDFDAAVASRAASIPPKSLAGFVDYAVERAPSPDWATRRIASFSQKMILEGGREYSAETCSKQKVRMKRYAAPDACAWCRYLAVQQSRYDYDGYELEFALKGSPSAGFHEHCRCVLVPDVEYIEPDYVARWDDQLEEAQKNIAAEYRDKKGRVVKRRGYGANSWRDVLSEMRRLDPHSSA